MPEIFTDINALGRFPKRFIYVDICLLQTGYR